MEGLQRNMYKKSVGSILFVDQYSHVGGGQKSLVALVKIALSVSTKVKILAPSGDFATLLSDSFGDRVRRYELPEVRLSPGKKFLKDFLFYVYYLIKIIPYTTLARQFDIIYINGPRLFLPFFIISRIYPRAFIYHVRIDHSWLEKKLISMIARSCSTRNVIANSPYILARLINSDSRLSDCSRLVCIENSLYPPFNSLPFDSDRGHSFERQSAAIIGRISPEKGHQWLPQIAKALPEMNFFIIGKCCENGDDFLKSILSRCPGNVIYLGFSHDVFQLVKLHGIRFLLVPSLWEEPFGLVAIEGMAMSCVTLMSNRGMLSAIAEKTGGILVDSCDQLIERLRVFINLPGNEILSISREQYDKVNEVYGYERFRDEIVFCLEGGVL